MPNPNQPGSDHVHDRDGVIRSTRNQVGSDQSHVDRDDAQTTNHGIAVSTLKFTGVSNLTDPAELKNHVANLIRKHSNPGDEISAHAESADILTYQMGEKNLALSIANHVEAAFKGFSPVVEIHNPEKNEFYNITVAFHPLVVDDEV